MAEDNNISKSDSAPTFTKLKPAIAMAATFITILGLGYGVLTLTTGHSGNHRSSSKADFFIRTLELTPQEAQLFWPIYEEYAAKKEVARTNFNKISERIASSSKDTLTMVHLEALSNEYELALTEESNLLKEYYQKFKEVLPLEKALKVYITEESFNKHWAGR